MTEKNFVPIEPNLPGWKERFSETAIKIALSTPLVQIALLQQNSKVEYDGRKQTDS